MAPRLQEFTGGSAASPAAMSPPKIFTESPLVWIATNDRDPNTFRKPPKIFKKPPRMDHAESSQSKYFQKAPLKYSKSPLIWIAIINRDPNIY
jgi:hypothetical protein